MTAAWVFLLSAFAAEPASPIVITKVGDIYPILPPPGARNWDPNPLIAAIKASEATFTPKDVYELVDHQVRPDIITPVAAKAALFFDPNTMIALSIQQERARAAAPKSTVTLDQTSFSQLFEAFSDYRNEVKAADARVGALGERRPDESQSMYERRSRTRDEQLVRARGPFEGRIGGTTFAVTLPATTQDRDGCSRAVATWDASNVDFDLFRFTMGTTRASSAAVVLTASPSLEKAVFSVEGTRRFEIVGRCGTSGSKARVTMTRTAEGVWSGSGGL